MLILPSTSEKIEIVLGGAVTVNQLQCLSCWRDMGVSPSSLTPGGLAVNTNNTTDVDLVPAPAASIYRIIDLINVYNKDTTSDVVTIKYSSGGTEYILWKGTLLPDQTLIYTDASGWNVSNGSIGYTLTVQALTSSPADAQTVYFGNLPKAPVTVAATSKVTIPKSGIIKRADIYCYSGTAGTAENWSLYVRVNNATDYLIATVGSATSERIFSNSSLSIPVSAGDYIEIKGVQPTWVTNPATTIYGGNVYVE